MRRQLFLLLLLAFPILPALSQETPSPYVAVAADLDIENDTVLERFKYSGQGDDPAWVIIPDEFGITDIADFGTHYDWNTKEATLKRVSLPHTLRRIGSSSFVKCRLEQVDINPEVEVIGEDAFFNNRLKEVSLPPSLRVCEINAFACRTLSKINWSDDPHCYIEKLSGFATDTALRYVEVPPYVKALTTNAFTDVFPDSIKLHEGLDSMSFAFSARNFGEYSYKEKRYRLKKIKFPNSLRYINIACFEYAYGLQSIEFGTGLEMIGSEAFRFNNSLPNISFPENLKSIGVMAFSGCSKLKKVDFNKNLQEIAQGAFLDCALLSDYTLPESLQTLGREAFRGTTIADLRIPASIKKVPKLCFSYCTYTPDAKITFAEGIDEIADSAFYNFVRITEGATFTDSVTLVLPHTLRRIGARAFEMVWVRETPLPQTDEHGNRLVWSAYLNGVLEKDDVKTIGGNMATGFQRPAFYEYVATLAPDPPSAIPSVPQPDTHAAQLYDLSGRPVRNTHSTGKAIIKKGKSASVILK